jgi:hypothetical protein
VNEGPKNIGAFLTFLHEKMDPGFKFVEVKICVTRTHGIVGMRSRTSAVARPQSVVSPSGRGPLHNMARSHTQRDGQSANGDFWTCHAGRAGAHPYPPRARARVSTGA